MSILDRIVDHKRRVVDRRKRSRPASALRKELRKASPGQLLDALGRNGEGLTFMAEVKRQAPSSGRLTDLSPGAIAGVYEHAGVDAVSVLTDEEFFGQSLTALQEVGRQSDRPRLRKDFVIDEYQIWETAHAGAEGLLLIASVLDPVQLRDYHEMARELGLDPLVEIHSLEEWEQLGFAPPLVGINNRTLDGDFSTDLAVTESIAPELPEETVVISESGINRPEDLERLLRTESVNGVLVGTALTRNADSPEDVAANLDPLLKAARPDARGTRAG